MIYRWFTSPKAIVLTPLLLVLVFIVACGSAASTPVVVEKEVIKEVIKEVPVEVVKEVVKEVIREVVKEVPVEVVKEVVKEVPRELLKVVTATPGPTPTPPAGLQLGGVISAMAYTSLRVWDPILAGSNADIIWASPLFNQVVEYNPETDDPFDIRGDLAETWEVSSDGLTYTFHLAEKAVWHDGEPITADDVVFSLDRMTGKLGPIRSPRGGQIKPYYKSSEAVDPHTVKVETNFVAAAFLPFLAVDYMKIVPKHLIGAGVEFNKYENVVGGGPFTLKNYIKGSGGEFVKNDDYFKEGYPRLDGINVFVVPSSGTASALFTAGQILMSMGAGTNMNVIDVADLAKDQDHLDIIWVVATILQGVMFNTNVKPYDDPRVRKAIYLALDRDKIIDGLGRLGFETVGTPFTPNSWFGKTEEEIRQLPGFRQPKDQDIAEAKRLLAEAGYPDGFKTTLNALGVSTNPLLAELTKPQLEEALNIEVEIRVTQYADGYASYESGDWELANQSNGFLILEPDSIFAALYRQGGGRNYPNWSDPKIDELYEKQTRELDRVKRRALIQEAEDILLEGTHNWAGIFWDTRGLLHNKKVQNIHGGPSLQVQLKYEHIWLKP